MTGIPGMPLGPTASVAVPAVEGTPAGQPLAIMWCVICAVVEWAGMPDTTGPLRSVTECLDRVG
jgi:hypothetical protein